MAQKEETRKVDVPEEVTEGLDTTRHEPDVTRIPFLPRLQQIKEDSRTYMVAVPPVTEQLKIDVKESPGAIVAKEIHYHSHGGTETSLLENMKARTNATLDQFNMDTFCLTRATNRAMDCLKYGFVFLEGKDESGKSSQGYFLMNNLSCKDYIPLILKTPEEFSHVPFQEQYVVFIDDIYGQKVLSKELVIRWSNVLDDIFHRVKSGNLYLIVSSKVGFIDESQRWVKTEDMLDRRKRIQLSDPEMSLRDYEKVLILENLAKHLRFQKDSPLLVKTASLCTHPWFFVCCKTVARHRINIKEWPVFFGHPITILYQKIVNLKMTDPVRLATLILIMKGSVLFGGQSDESVDQELELLSSLKLLPRNCCIVDITDAAASMVGDFLTHQDENYTFIHGAIKLAVFFVFWEVEPVSSISWCPVEFLINNTTVDYVRDNSLQQKRIEKKHFQVLKSRILKCFDVQFVKHSVFKINDFVHMFLANNPHLSEKMKVVEVLGISAVYGHTFLLKEILETWRKFNVPGKTQVERIVLEIACMCGHVDTVKMLIDDGIEPCESTAVAACLVIHTHKLLPLLPKAIIPSKEADISDTSLKGLINFNSGACLKLVLDSMRDETNRQGLALRGRLISCQEGNFEMFKVFEQVLGDVTSDFSLLLMKTIEGGNILILFHLMQKRARRLVVNEHTFVLACALNKNDVAKVIWEESDSFTKSIIMEHVHCGMTALHIVASAKSREGLELLSWMLDEKFPVHKTGSLGQTALHVASSSGNVEATIKLLKEGSDISVTNDDGNTALHLQCTSDQPVKDLLEVLLNAQANICALNKDNKTPLHVLCEKQSEARSTVMSYLIKCGAPVDSVDNKGHTPLYLLLDLGFCLEEVELLLENGAKVDIKDINEETSLHAASRSNNSKAVRMIVEKKANLTVKDKNGAHCLHHAVSAMNNGDVVNYLLQEGMNEYINHPDNYGNTALHEAVKIPYNEDVVALLLKSTADPILVNKDGYTAFDIVCKGSNDSSLAYLEVMMKSKPAMLAAKGNQSPLHLACASTNKNTLGIVKRLLDEGVCISAKNESGKTALHLLTEESSCLSFLVGQELCARGATLDCTDQDGNSPLHLACYSEGDSRIQMIELLVNQGAKVTVKNSKGLSPFTIAQQEGYGYLLEIMSDAILSQACRTKGKYTDDEVDEALAMEIQWSTLQHNSKPILHRVCSVHGEYSPVIVTRLLHNGVDITAREKDGMTVFHSACLVIGRHTKSLLTTLMEWNGEILAVDTKGQTALHKAIVSDNEYAEEVLNWLVKSGLHPNTPDDNGDTPLHLVCSSRGPYRRPRIRWLLKNGADLNYVNNKGETPYDKAVNSAENRQSLAMEVLLLHIQKAERLEPRVINHLQEKGANINSKDTDGNTVLHLLVLYSTQKSRSCTKDNIKLMLSLGADVTAQNNASMTPYEMAIHQGMGEDVLELLCPPYESDANLDKDKPSQEPQKHGVLTKGPSKEVGIKDVKKTQDHDGDSLDDLACKAGNLKNAAKDLVGSAADALAKGVKKLLD